ncbi:phage tail protein [Pectobacterium versatile]|uniref:tail fiber protein n=1 Tax=Pectobacterium versatile TaxID=2488639 RepID=UPI000D4EE90A|nr:tail fiber protein [Pectobacterium versatile]POY55668.1 phage tail protein [Pectobacterium versatile]
MANLSENPQWVDGIYQIETSDPVVGGPDGVSNRQAKELASRTRYLKKEQEKTGSDLATHAAAADPHTQYAPKENPTFTGAPKAPTPATDSNSQQVATTAFVKSVVAALINGAPAALDTLQELAKSLGNDPSFSATVLNAIADVKTEAANKLNTHNSAADPHTQYAPKASPALTGKPTAPTAAQASNDTQVATTAFVKAAVAALVNGSPAALDTLQELANALGNDPNFSTTILNSLAGKLAKDQNGADILDASLFRKNIDIGEFRRNSVVLGTVDTEQYFNVNTPDGNYIVGGNPDVLKIPISDAFLNWRRFIGNDGSFYGVLNIVGFYTPSGGQFRQFHKVVIKGQWQSPTEIFNDSCRLINGEVSAATNPFMGIGFYNGDFGNWPSAFGVVLQSYKKDAGAISLMQESVSNANHPYRLFGRNIVVKPDGGATYGVPVEFYHTGHLPTANDVGALPITGGVIQGGIRIDRGNIDLPATRAVVGMMPNGSYRQMLTLSPDNTVVVGDPNSSIVIHTNDRAYIAVAGGKWCAVYHEGNLTSAAIGAMPSAELVGMPQLFPGAVAPAGWLKCNGQQFDTTQFPVLASRYPSGFLPDLRGEFVRGWDDGRGVDAGRGLLSVQGDAIRNITGQFETVDHPDYSLSGVFSTKRRDGASLSGQYVGQHHTYVDFDASKVVPTANENRPRNIAFNYIVRAA